MSAVEKLYCGTMTVYEKTGKFNEDAKVTSFENKVVLTDEPCRISYSNVNITEEHDGASKKMQEIKLFCSPDIVIKEGSKIVVTQHGVTETYLRSGTPAVYNSHQEIKLKLFEGWA